MNDITLAKAREPFFTTKGIGKGTGLGLSMVHGLTAQSGGAMQITSQPGQGTVVSLWLPRARRDELATQPGDDPTGPERGVFSTRSPARPNPIGLHRVTVVEIGDGRLRVEPLEAIDQTPLVDIKPVIGSDNR